MPIILLILFLLCLLTNCTIKSPINHSYPTNPIDGKKQKNKKNILLSLNDTNNELIKINWENILRPLIKNLVSIEEINFNHVFLVKKIINNTNIFIPIDIVTILIINLLRNEAVKVIEEKEIDNNAKILFNLDKEDNLESFYKEVEIAHYLNIHYILSSKIEENMNKLNISIQLILVKSGEIIWSNNVYL
ncbi:penicillin-binding protein activator LpoB [Candidatus Schneideria nysicola]|uniref:penicillin-binding protein activator LpoB n=1 Tax=Candidatus Schneideria nysicola TaxID=1081631 RepID=UPI001CAA4263|nr:penicillin-binding protein activator LpoB [Candidatus Schneideria nysicola]UAJ65925.1 hypothetical protein KEC38_02010 [Candidatus Schneideria nysicola]